MVNGRAAAILRWYASHARDLPWRRPDASPWAILVSEIMLQQTPVARVLPPYEAWLARGPRVRRSRWPRPPRPPPPPPPQGPGGPGPPPPPPPGAPPPADAVRQWG